MEKLYTVKRSSIQHKTGPGVDCGADHELLTTKFRLKLKKGKTIALTRRTLARWIIGLTPGAVILF